MKENNQSKEDYLKELYMLTGKVTNDITYLYYLLIKDGCYFKKETPPEVIQDASTVSSFADWFEGL